jgi:DNA topoisomerase-1
MERAGIGTKATRAEVIETLYRRGYVTGQRIVATPLASCVIEILEKYCHKVVDVAFTRELEARMEKIELGSETREMIVNETIEYLKPIIEAVKSREREIGEELTVKLSEMREELVTLLYPCPQCGSRLRVVKNPRTKKRFIGCSGKWKKNCNFSLPLPQFGSLTLLQKRCPECGFQLIQVSTKGRGHPLTSCCRCYVSKGKAALPLPQTHATRSFK